MRKKPQPAAKPRLEQAGGEVHVSGDLTFATVTALWRDSRPLLAAGGAQLQIDLAGVGRADSAGLALLVEWLRSARAAGTELVFLAVPAQLLAIASASGVEHLLPLQVP